MGGRAAWHRRSIRLAGYDYAQAGAYFVTIGTQGRSCLLGDVVNGETQPSPAGDMVQAVWDQVPARYPGVATDAFVVMPNHVHGIIVLVGAGPRARPGGQPQGVAAAGQPQGVVAAGQPQGVAAAGQPQGVAPTMSLADVVHRFKTLTTKRYADGVKRNGWTPFPGRLWQRNYYEHVIRNEAALERIQRYIADNPANWADDLENPVVVALRGDPAGRPYSGQARLTSNSADDNSPSWGP